MTVTLVNLSQTEERTVVIQTGTYGEHSATDVTAGDRRWSVNAPWFDLRLAPGAGTRMRIGMQRYQNQPSLDFPWERIRKNVN